MHASTPAAAITRGLRGLTAIDGVDLLTATLRARVVERVAGAIEPSVGARRWSGVTRNSPL